MTRRREEKARLTYVLHCGIESPYSLPQAVVRAYIYLVHYYGSMAARAATLSHLALHAGHLNP